MLMLFQRHIPTYQVCPMEIRGYLLDRSARCYTDVVPSWNTTWRPNSVDSVYAGKREARWLLVYSVACFQPAR